MRVLVISALIGALAIAGAAPIAHAQGGMGGVGGMGGRGGRGGGPGGMRGRPGAGDMAKRFEQMASLKPVLKDVKLDGAAKDSLKSIEKAYKSRFKEYAQHAKRLFESEGPPDIDELRKLRDGARTLQDDEFAAARAVIADSERAQFDRNVILLREGERQGRDERRRGGMGRPGGAR